MTIDIYSMAQEAGIRLASQSDPIDPKNVYLHELERFAALVAVATRESMKSEGWRQCAVGQRTTQFCGQLEKAVEAEREACIRIISETEFSSLDHMPSEAALLIRAGGNNNDA